MSFSTLTKCATVAIAPVVWSWAHPKTFAALLGGAIITRATIKLYVRLYHQHISRQEFIPTCDDRNILVRHIINTTRFTYALVRYKTMTVGGYFPPNVQYYSALMEASIVRKNDLRPSFVPAGDSIEVFPCNSVHSHPRSAEFRSSANEYLVNMVKRAGYDPYCVSSSRRDTSAGNRFFFCSKDFGIEYRNDPIHDNTAFVFTDVDYYADMPRWMNLWKPICMYTLVPETLNHNNSEYCYHFEGNELVYNVSGGGGYRHLLWDYKGDTLTAIDLDGNLLVFDIEQRAIKGDEQHRLVWLLPKAKVTDPLWIAVYFDWHINLLSRKNVKMGPLLALWEPISDNLSIGVDGSNYSVTLNGKLFEAIRTRLQFKDSAPFVSDVERMLKEAKHEGYARDAPILFKCFGLPSDIKPNVIKTGCFPVTYQAIPKRGGLSTEDAGMPGQVITTPLVSQPALFASKGVNADIACIEGRLDRVKNDKRFPPKYRKFADEFVHRLVPEHLVGTGVPMSVGEVRVSQDKKAQRGRFDQVAPMMSTNVENKIKAFIKTETYASAKPPRNISTMSPEITIQSSAFSLVIANVFKQHPWYCPGKPPRKIIERLDEVMNMDKNEDLEEGDYTCLDGTQSPDYSNLLLLPTYMRYFAPEHRGEFRRLYKQIYKNSATTSTGVAYKPRMTVRSGSSITTQAGTIDNAFNVYCALRNMGYTPEEAWDRIGAIFGDDSLNANHRGEFREFVEQVVNDLGMIYKSNLRPRGEPVLFLGRYFVDPTTSSDSFADPMRTIAKLHATANKMVSPEQGAANKAHGYITTDLNTPIIGTWASRVIDITKLKFKNGTGEEQYKCSNAWPQRDRGAIANAMAAVIGITVEELLEKDRAVKAVTGLDQFPILFDTEYKHSQCAVVDGDLVGTDLHQSTSEQDERQSDQGSQSLQQASTEAATSVDNVSERPVKRAQGSGSTTKKCRIARPPSSKRPLAPRKAGGRKPPSSAVTRPQRRNTNN
nr:MAG: RNA-dependent RNA polymerase [Wufeng shrew nodavirus 4]